MDLLLRRREDGVEILTLNRPDKRNALNQELVDALHLALDDLSRDPELRCVVLGATGDTFMGGADIAQLRERGAAEALASINGSLFRRIEELPVPVVAAVRGYALGGGCELALACDLRVAGESAVFGQPEVALGILPGAGATYRLPRLVGLGLAKELIFTGRRVRADEALGVGLVNVVVSDDEVDARALALATTISQQGAMAVRLAKSALHAATGVTVSGGALESLAQGVLFESDDKRERMTRFLERKRP